VSGYKWIGETVIVYEYISEPFTVKEDAKLLTMNEYVDLMGKETEKIMKQKYPALYQKKTDSPTQNKLF